jgi:hypothetical protein
MRVWIEFRVGPGAGFCKHANKPSAYINGEGLLERQSDYQLLGKNCYVQFLSSLFGYII